MVEAEIVGGEVLEAILALVRVAQKQVTSRERRVRPVLVHEFLPEEGLLNRNDGHRWVNELCTGATVSDRRRRNEVQVMALYEKIKYFSIVR